MIALGVDQLGGLQELERQEKVLQKMYTTRIVWTRFFLCLYISAVIANGFFGAYLGPFEGYARFLPGEVILDTLVESLYFLGMSAAIGGFLVFPLMALIFLVLRYGFNIDKEKLNGSLSYYWAASVLGIIMGLEIGSLLANGISLVTADPSILAVENQAFPLDIVCMAIAGTLICFAFYRDKSRERSILQALRSFQVPGLPLLPPSLEAKSFQVQMMNQVEIIIPPVTTIPEGPFIMGSDRDELIRHNADSQHTVVVERYEIGLYPLTVAEYACFLQATGYPLPPLLLEEDNTWEGKRLKRVLTWGIQLSRCSDHPIVGISWTDAQAYAHWLAQITGESWRLPSEAEWEKAARGIDNYLYPWGNAEPLREAEEIRFNSHYYRNSPGYTTPVGIYPGGKSPYGLYDVVGNVAEWTGSLEEAKSVDASGSIEQNEARVTRGGSWTSAFLRDLYITTRTKKTIGDKDDYTGVRLVRDGMTSHLLSEAKQ